MSRIVAFIADRSDEIESRVPPSAASAGKAVPRTINVAAIRHDLNDGRTHGSIKGHFGSEIFIEAIQTRVFLLTRLQAP